MQASSQPVLWSGHNKLNLSPPSGNGDGTSFDGCWTNSGDVFSGALIPPVASRPKQPDERGTSTWDSYELQQHPDCHHQGHAKTRGQQASENIVRVQ